MEMLREMNILLPTSSRHTCPITQCLSNETASTSGENQPIFITVTLLWLALCSLEKNSFYISQILWT